MVAKRIFCKLKLDTTIDMPVGLILSENEKGVREWAGRQSDQENKPSDKPEGNKQENRPFEKLFFKFSATMKSYSDGISYIVNLLPALDGFRLENDIRRYLKEMQLPCLVKKDTNCMKLISQKLLN